MTGPHRPRPRPAAVPAPAPLPLPPARQFVSVEDFFTGFLAPLFARDPDRSGRWCVRWREHLEAEVVVGALWDSYEVLVRDEDMGMAVWMRDYAYPLMSRLFEPDGTFSACNRKVRGHDPDGVVPLSSGPPGY